MIYIVSLIHILTCVFVVIFILLQDPKGGVLGALGGGAASKSLFGAGGASDFLVKTTKWLAITFACTSIYLSYISSNQESDLMSGPQPVNESSTNSSQGQSSPTDSKTQSPKAQK